MNNKLINQGWECPKCGSVYSPYTSKCSMCPQGNITGSTTHSTNICLSFIPDTVNPEDTNCMRCGKAKWQHQGIGNPYNQAL
jgi:ribosomal protein S27AE